MNEDKLRAKAIATKEKLMKKIVQKQQKNIQPGECMKFIQVNIDNGIKINFDFYQETVTMLESTFVTSSIKSSPYIPNNGIMWTKIIEEYSINDNFKIDTKIKKELMNHVLLVWKWDQVVNQIHDKIFSKTIASIVDSMPHATLTLVIYGMKYYFQDKKLHRKNKQSDINIDMMAGIPKISTREFEVSLIDVQLDLNLNIRLIENSADMSLLIYQYTKAIAEQTYKSKINTRLYDQIDFYATEDNKKTVKVDNRGYGLKTLWLKQLCMFNSSNLATADAIFALHPSPDKLINAFMKCSAEERDLLLKDIQIKRADIGHLTKIRKLGPELSRRIHTMFTSVDGEQLIN